MWPLVSLTSNISAYTWPNFKSKYSFEILRTSSFQNWPYLLNLAKKKLRYFQKPNFKLFLWTHCISFSSVLFLPLEIVKIQANSFSRSWTSQIFFWILGMKMIKYHQIYAQNICLGWHYAMHGKKIGRSNFWIMLQSLLREFQDTPTCTNPIFPNTTENPK